MIGIQTFLIKVIIKLPLFSPKNLTRAVDVQNHSFLTSELDEGELSTFRPDRLNPGRQPGTHGIRGWVGFRAYPDIFGEEKNLQLLLEFTSLHSPARSLVSTLSWLTSLLF